MTRGTKEPQGTLQNFEQKMKAPTMSTQPGVAVYHDGLIILQMKGALCHPSGSETGRAADMIKML